jgi:hypothetical protein
MASDSQQYIPSFPLLLLLLLLLACNAGLNYWLNRCRHCRCRCFCCQL